MSKTQDLLYCVRHLRVFDRFARFPDEPERPGEHQVLVRWWNDFQQGETGRPGEVLGSGATQEAAAVDALQKLDDAIGEQQDRLGSLRKRVRESLLIAAK